jgi:hypothetical protein
MYLPRNPWLDLPDRQPFALPDDLSLIEEFNRKSSANYQVDLNLLPEPFIGRPDAPVVLLNLNPGWSPGDAEWHAKHAFVRLIRANLHTPFALVLSTF